MAGKERQGSRQLPSRPPRCRVRSAHTCAYCVHLSVQTEAHTMTLAYCIITLEHSRCMKCARRPIDGAPTGEGFIRSNFPPLSPSARSQRPNRVVFIYEIKAILPLHNVRNAAMSARDPVRHALVYSSAVCVVRHHLLRYSVPSLRGEHE